MHKGFHIVELQHCRDLGPPEDEIVREGCASMNPIGWLKFQELCKERLHTTVRECQTIFHHTISHGFLTRVFEHESINLIHNDGQVRYFAGCV
jgi:hypothetical protein